MGRRPTNGHGGAGHNSGTIWLGRQVNVVDRDPEIAVFQKIWERTALGGGDLAVLAGLSASTVANLFINGKTKRPQHVTYAKMAGAMGKKYTLVDDHAVDFEKEIPKARAEFKAYKQALAKKKARKR